MEALVVCISIYLGITLIAVFFYVIVKDSNSNPKIVAYISIWPIAAIGLLIIDFVKACKE